MRTIAAGKFKAHCLSLLDEVKSKREPILVTKHGHAYAKLVPLELEDDPLEAFRFPGKVEIVGDIMSPLYTDQEIGEFFERSAAQLK